MGSKNKTMTQQYLIPNLRETIRDMIFQWYKDGQCIYQHAGEEVYLKSELSSVDFVKQTDLTQGVYRTTDDAYFQVYDSRIIRLEVSSPSYYSREISLMKHGQRVSVDEFDSIFRGHIPWGVKEIIYTPHIKFLTDIEYILDIILEAEIWQTAVQILGIDELEYEKDPDRFPSITFNLLEAEETIPTYFSVNLNLADRHYYSYDISKNYLQALRKKVKPIVPYKDAGKFNYPPHTVLSTHSFAAAINYFLNEKEVDRIFFYYTIKSLEPSLRPKLAEFIFNDQQDYAIIHFTDMGLPRPGYYPLKAVRLYKTLAYDYSEDLKRIDSFKRRGLWAGYAYGYLVNAIGIEISPDDCLELYAPSPILSRLFLEYIIDVKKEQCADGTEFHTGELNICVWPSFTPDEPFVHYENIIGSAQNKILYDEFRILFD